MSSRGFAYWKRADELIRLALEEDLPGGDVTTDAVLPERRDAEAVVMAKEDLTVSGIDVARRVFETVDPEVKWHPAFSNGDSVPAGTVLARVEGGASSLMAAERTALNFMQHLSGIASATRRIVELVGDFPAVILDTRKTLPGWRLLEKAAVLDGGGANHRFSLSDMVLIKDNHIKLCGGVFTAVERARARLPARTRIEVEAADLHEVEEALQAGADVILFDNATPERLAEVLSVVGERAPCEVSGGITEGNVIEMARTGVAMISMGSITHSARAVDISLEIS